MNWTKIGDKSEGLTVAPDDGSVLDQLRDGLRLYRTAWGRNPARLQLGRTIAQRLGREIALLNKQNGVHGSRYVERLQRGDPLIQQGDEILGLRVELEPIDDDNSRRRPAMTDQPKEIVPGTDGIPRRVREDLAVPAEVYIRRALQYVEGLGADERLTKASMLLGQALDRVADYIESLPADDPKRRPAREVDDGQPFRIPIEPKYEIDLDGVVFNRQSGNPIPTDEPLIVFRAQDARLPAVLAGYLASSADPEHRQAVALRLAEVAQWQAENPLRVKEPDTVLDENWRSLERPNASEV